MAWHSILVVDDEKVQRESLSGFLKKKGFTVFLAESGEAALAKISSENIDLVLTDFRMSGINGLEMLRQIHSRNPTIMVIMMTAFGKIEDAVAAMKAGAFDYLTKPIDLDELELNIKRSLHYRQLKIENETLRHQVRERHRFAEIITGSTQMEEALSIAARAAESSAPVLIEGESGTGKELVAQAIHYTSPRGNKPLITVNCAALAENLLESELFGHEKGAFTGAVKQRIGRFEEADGGTLFLDEVGDIPQSTQVKLLRFLQFGEFQRVGSNETLKVDVRLISATNRNLAEMIAQNKFRDDFYYRLNVVNIIIPPLRIRKNDIVLLIDHFLKKFRAKYGKEISGISRQTLDILINYSFPGNIRELENIIERSFVLARDEIIQESDLPLQLTTSANVHTSISPLEYYKGSFDERVKQFEKDLITTALESSNGNQSAAARHLGMSERNLRYKLTKYKMKKKRENS